MVNAECGITNEHIKHIVVERTTLRPYEYTNRHNKVAGYIHWAIRKCIGLQVPDKTSAWKGHKCQGSHYFMGHAVITDQTITANRLDIVIKHDKKREYLPTDQYSHTRWFKHYHRISWKIKQLQSPRDPGQQDVASEDKNCASYNWCIKKN